MLRTANLKITVPQWRVLYWQISDEVPPAYGPHRDFDAPEPGDANSPVLDDLFQAMIEADTILDATLFVIKCGRLYARQ